MAHVMVNPNKEARAKEIVALFTKSPKNSAEQELKDKFLALVKENKVAEKDYVLYVYEKLGGLVRTEAEHKEALGKEAETKAKFEKKGKKNEK